jgi:opacity protein-like surface antigen
MKKSKWLSLILLFFASAACAQAKDGASLNQFSELLAGSYSQAIVNTAASSSCASYSWRNRGDAPLGYIKGVALSFARSLCRLHTNSTVNHPAIVMSTADTKNSTSDALAYYAGIFSKDHIAINVTGENTLRALYTLGMGLGMRESSGAYCEGWDVTAGAKRPSSAGEAGLFQTSYDSMTATPELQQLYDEYRANTSRCMLDVFKEEATCRPQSILGTGAGADFQKFNKACPAFATEYAMTLLRVLRSHFGPINRREAEVKTTCNQMLASVQQIVDSNPSTACEELF